MPFTLSDHIHPPSFLKVVRDKAVIKTAPGTRQCKCKMQMVTKQLGPGVFQQYHQQVGSRRG